MKQNSIDIEICKSIDDVFEFTTNPEKTHLWIPGIVKEVATRYPPIKGSIYQNTKDNVNWDSYVVVEFEPNKIFSLINPQRNYIVKYTYDELDKELTKLNYYERAKRGELESPFTQDILDNLKRVMEGS